MRLFFLILLFILSSVLCCTFDSLTLKNDDECEKKLNLTRSVEDEEDEENEEYEDDNSNENGNDNVNIDDNVENFNDFDKFTNFQKAFDHFEAQFDNFEKRFHKVYSTPEEREFRRKLYTKNMMTVGQHNIKFKSGKNTYKLAENEFTDLEYDEFVSKFTGLSVKKFSSSKGKKVGQSIKKSKIPKMMDWRKKNAVSPVLHQGECGSCWTFASSGVLEGALAIKTGILRQLSKQQLLDCVDKDPKICDEGGTDDMAYEYLTSHGLLPYSKYPYIGHKTKCKYSKKLALNLGKPHILYMENERDIQLSLAKIGPVYGVIHVTKNFMLYESGIFNDDDCNDEVNHAILFVGYGENKDRVKYWIIKNSYGKDWGENGFVRVVRNQNMCKLGEYGSVVVLR